ncbi:MAG: GtrA family protein [Coriobacteriales bacterium]|nr:GtrA family protein [Coriobacteriales bacterium]
MNKTHELRVPRFAHFAASSLLCTGVDQLTAWMLFSTLRPGMGDADLLRIMTASVIARVISLSLNYVINHWLFAHNAENVSDVRSHSKSLPRFIVLSVCILTLSCLGVWWAHTTLGAPEWQAKPVVDFLLFFVNYNLQRTWVFKSRAHEATSLA